MPRLIDLPAVDAPPAAACWSWVLAKQALHANAAGGPANLTAAAGIAVGLHAARVASPYVAAAARTGAHVDLGALVGPGGDRDLVTIRCMRKTLHALPVALASVAHAATLRYRLRDARTSARRTGVDAPSQARAAAAVVEVLGAAAHLDERSLEQAVCAATGVPVSASRAALKWLWETGQVTYRNCAPSWHRQARRFSLRSHAHPGFDPHLDQAQSRRSLIHAYFRAYGPATVRDAAWWSALPQSEVADALLQAGAVSLSLPWSRSSHYMLPDDYDALAGSPSPGRSPVHFLAHEDPLLKAYSESRARYLGVLPPNAVFNRIGEALPTVLADGLVAALWRWDHSAAEARWTALPQGAARLRQVELQAAARRTTARLRDRYVPTRPARGVPARLG